MVKNEKIYKAKVYSIVKVIKMSKLTIVRQSLETNPEVVITKVFEKSYLPGRDGFWSHTMDFFVAPKNGLYTAEELQKFMMGLVPEGLQPTCKDDFSQYDQNSDLSLGKLYFDEDIGQEKVTRICTLTDEQLFNVSKFINGQRTIEESRAYQRRTWVRPFPSESLVRDLLEGKLSSEYRIRPEELKRYQPGFFQRIVGRR